MRPLRHLILLLVLAATLVVALMRPLPSNATETVPTTTSKKHTRQPRKLSAYQRRHRAAVRARRTFGPRVAKYARQFLGVPYVYGGSTPHPGFDCSGFVSYVYKHFGISLPHSTYSQLSRGHKVLRKYLKPGDLVFFAGGGHVGLYLRGNRVIDAPHTGAVVRISTMTDWYSSSYYTGRRVRH